MNMFRKIKSKMKGIFALLLGCAILAQTLSFAPIAKADGGPRFNFLQGDWSLLRGANRTQNQSDWANPVSGVAGDTFAGIIYYHNGEIGTVANNVNIKVNVPETTTNGGALIHAAISADNAETITDTVINGHVEGQSGLAINLDQDARLALVPGSVKWFPEFQSMDTSRQDLPFNQSGDEIIGSGINIGNIQGCWPHIGYITFLIKTQSIAQPSVAIQKFVRNVTAGEAGFVKQNMAKPGEILEYQVIVNNNGNAGAANLYLSDALPANTIYIPGSTVISKNGGAFANMNDGITGDGVTLGDFNPSDSAEVRFKVQVSQGVASGETLTNTAYLHFNKEVLPSTATTIVKFGIVSPVSEQLPKTGAETAIFSILLAALVSLIVAYRKKLAILKTLR